MDKFIEMQQQVDPLDAHRLELEVQQLEQDCLRSKSQNSSIVVSKNQGQITTSSNEGTSFILACVLCEKVQICSSLYFYV